MVSFLGGLFLGAVLDDSDGDGSLHVSDGESSERWVLGEGLAGHGLGGLEDDQGGISGLDELGLVFDGLSASSVDLAGQGLELTGDVGGVAVQDWSVTGADLSWVVHDDDLGEEVLDLSWGVVLGVSGDVSSLDVLDVQTLDVESDVVSGDGLGEGLVMHLNGLDFGLHIGGGEVDGHSWLEDTGLHSSDWDGSDTSDLVDVLEGESEGLLGGSGGGDDGIEGLDEDLSLVPGGVGGSLQHVVSVESRDGDEWHVLDVESDLLQELLGLLDDLLVSLLAVVDGLLVDLVDTDDDLLDTQGEGQESVLSGLALSGDTSLELSLGRGDHKESAIGLGGSGDHVLDEVSVSGGIDDGEVILGGIELPEGDVDGDTSLSLGLELVHDPSVLERGLSEIGGLLLELLDGSLVDTSALVDQVSGGGGFTSVDVSNDDNVDVSLFFGHF